MVVILLQVFPHLFPCVYMNDTPVPIGNYIHVIHMYINVNVSLYVQQILNHLFSMSWPQTGLNKNQDIMN